MMGDRNMTCGHFTLESLRTPSLICVSNRIVGPSVSLTNVAFDWPYQKQEQLIKCTVTCGIRGQRIKGRCHDILACSLVSGSQK